LEAGFADQSHFTRTFKLVTGLTPKRYRETIAPKKGLGWQLVYKLSGGDYPPKFF